jgi:hypothetical protein
MSQSETGHSNLCRFFFYLVSLSLRDVKGAINSMIVIVEKGMNL